jgi:hypothetical protein
MVEVLSTPKPTLRERRYQREAARYDRAIQTILRAARIADEARRKLDRWDRENLRRPPGTMTGEEAIEAVGGPDALEKLTH